MSPAPRRFDHDEARRLRAEGLSYNAIGRALGVTDTAVKRVCNPHIAARMEAQHAAWQSAGHCPDCGVPTTRHRVGGDLRCRDCASRYRAVSVRPDALQCCTCQVWKPDDSFPRHEGTSPHRRGRAQQCGACQTRQRQGYRERHKVACVGCGEPALPPTEKGTTGALFPRCRDCYLVWVRSPEQRRLAAERARRARNRVAA